MADAKNHDEQPIVFDLADETIVADTILPKFAKPGAVQSLANGARVFEWREALIEKLEDALAVLPIEFFQLARGR